MSITGFLPLYALTTALPGGVGATAALIAFVALWQVGLWRLAFIGVYVGAPGIRLRTLVRTRTIAWQDIHRVRARDDRQVPWLIIVTRDGSQIHTGVSGNSWPRRHPGGPALM